MGLPGSLPASGRAACDPPGADSPCLSLAKKARGVGLATGFRINDRQGVVPLKAVRGKFDHFLELWYSLVDPTKVVERPA